MFIGPQVSFLQDKQFYGQAKSSFSAPFNPFAVAYSRDTERQRLESASLAINSARRVWVFVLVSTDSKSRFHYKAVHFETFWINETLSPFNMI